MNISRFFTLTRNGIVHRIQELAGNLTSQLVEEAKNNRPFVVTMVFGSPNLKLQLAKGPSGRRLLMLKRPYLFIMWADANRAATTCRGNRCQPRRMPRIFIISVAVFNWRRSWEGSIYFKRFWAVQTEKRQPKNS